MIYSNLSIAEIVEPCSLEMESRLDSARQRAVVVEQHATLLQIQVARIRSDMEAAAGATRRGTALYLLTTDTICDQRAEEHRLEPVLLNVEQQITMQRQKTSALIHIAEQRSRDLGSQTSAATRVTDELIASLDIVATARRQMETMRDAADDMVDRFRAITRRQ